MESYQSDICRFIAVTVSPLFEKYQLNIFFKKSGTAECRAIRADGAASATARDHQRKYDPSSLIDLSSCLVSSS